MSWDGAFSQQLADMAANPAAAAPATLGQAWQAQWAAAGLDTSQGLGKPLDDAYDELSSQFEKTTGKRPDAFAKERGIALSPHDVDRKTQILGELAQELPAEQRQALDPFMDTRKRAREKAQATEREASEVGARTYGLSGAAVGFAAGIARQTVDPINLAAIAVTAPLSGGASVPMFLAREFAANAGAQALQEPFIESGRAGLGLEHGFGRAAGNVLEAGIGGMALGGLLRGGGAVLRRLHAPETIPLSDPGVTSRGSAAGEGARLAPGALDRAIPEEARAIAPEDLHAAAQFVERNQVLDDVARPHDPAGIETAHGALEAREPLPGPPRDDRMVVRETTNGILMVEPPNGRGAVLSLKPADDALTVGMVTVTAPNRGQGMGVALYERALEEAANRGVVLRSDASVTADAVRIYDALERRGYEVTLSPEALGSKKKGYSMPGLKGSVFEVKPKPVETPPAEPIKQPRPPIVQKRPMTLTQFIAKNGGLEMTGDHVAQNFHRTFVPGGGMLARKNGRSLDHWAEVLTEHGYFPRTADGHVDFAAVYDALPHMIHDELIGKQKHYSADRLDEVADLSAGELDNLTREIERTAATIRRQAAKAGLSDIDSGSLYDAAELLHRGDEKTWDAALERAFVTRELREEGDGGAHPVYDNVPPGWEADDLQRGTTPENGGASGSEGGGREEPGQAQGASRSGGDGAPARQTGGATEPTAAGEQRLIEGVEPISQRQRLEAQAGKSLKGGDAAAGGLFDADARAQTDLLDTIAEARRADVERALADNGGDMRVVLDDGREVSARELLAKTERDQAAAAELADCITKAGGGT